MEVRRLELLRELADRGSITAVAAATNRTPSAVSQQLKILEREVGIALTERLGRGLRLTGAGQMLAQTAADVAVALERADALWNDFKQAPQGTVTLSVFPTGGQMLLPGLLTAIGSVAGLDIHCTDQDPVLLDYAELVPDFDIVLADSPGVLPSWTGRGLRVVPLMTEPLDVALPEGHPLGAKSSLAPRDLKDESWISVPEGFPYDLMLKQIEAVNGSPARIAQRSIDNGIIEALVAAGHGVAILPRYTTRDHGNGIITRRLTGVQTTRRISALLRPDRAERPSVRVVLEALRTEAGRFEAEHNESGA